MPKLVITHDVADVDTWLQGKSERADAIGGMRLPRQACNASTSGRLLTSYTSSTASATRCDHSSPPHEPNPYTSVTLDPRPLSHCGTRVSDACVSRWPHEVELHPVDEGVVVDRARVCGAPTEAL